MEFFCYNQCPKLANYNILINARQAMVNWIEQLFVMLAHPDMIPPNIQMLSLLSCTTWQERNAAIPVKIAR